MNRIFPLLAASLLITLTAGCAPESSPESSPSASTSASTAAPRTDPLAPALDLLDSHQYGPAQTWLKTYCDSHPSDASARLLLENATADQAGKPITRLALAVSAGTLKGDEELRAAWVAEQFVNAHGGVGGSVLNLLPTDLDGMGHLSSDVLAMVVDDRMAVMAVTSGLPFISLLPPDPAAPLLSASFTPPGEQQWKLTAGGVQAKGHVLVLLEKGGRPPSAVNWAGGNVTCDMRPVGDPVDVSQYSTVVVATPWSFAPAAIETLTHSTGVPVWVCDLLGQNPSRQSSPPPPPAGTTFPDGVLVASEFGAVKSDPDQNNFTQAYMASLDHKHPGPWGWRTWRAIMALRDCATQGATRDQMRRAVHQMTFPPARQWFVLRYVKGDWEYVRTLGTLKG
ncbi:MAG TPA: hypothetical protein VGO93_06330 [Candidatus Xenobia bacterium]